jgi:hypothetical protein
METFFVTKVSMKLFSILFGFFNKRWKIQINGTDNSIYPGFIPTKDVGAPDERRNFVLRTRPEK